MFQYFTTYLTPLSEDEPLLRHHSLMYVKPWSVKFMLHILLSILSISPIFQVDHKGKGYTVFSPAI